MAVNLADLRHEEIWDDSMLIDSWNEALDEYKKYHSIRAKGGSVRELERELQSSSSEAPTLNADGPAEADVGGSISAKQPAKQDTAEPPVDAPARPSDAAIPPAFPPQAVLGTVRDEGLKKLLMSWYYAGYYTGLYEGQQQAQQQQS